MKNLITIPFLFSFLLSFSQYEYPKQEYAKLVLNSTLVVELLEGNEEDVVNMNNSIKDVFTKHWTATDVLFMTQPEIKTLCNKYKDGYAILYQDDFKYNERRSGYIDKNGGFGFGQGGQGDISTKYTAFSFSYFSAYLNIRIDGKNNFVTGVGFASGNLTKIDHLFLCQQMSLLIHASAEGKKAWEFFNVKKNLEDLKNTTLILPKFMLKEKDIDKIPKYYDYEHKLVDLEEYQNIVFTKKEGKSYIKIIWSRQHKLYMWIVVNAKDGTILSINSFGGVHFGSNQTAKEVIKVKYLKYAGSKLAQKVNNRYGWKF